MTRKRYRLILRVTLLMTTLVIVGICLHGTLSKYVSKRKLQSNVQISLLLQGDEADIYESPATLMSTGEYKLKTEGDLEAGEPTSNLVVRKNLYDYVLPGVNIPKDPKVFITKKSGTAAYLYIEVIEDNFPEYYTNNGFADLSVGTDNPKNVSPIYYELEEFWTPVLNEIGAQATGPNGGKLYVYYNSNDYFENYNKALDIKIGTGAGEQTITQNATCLSSYIMKSESDDYITKQDYYGENEVKIVDGTPIKCPSFNIIKDKTIYVSEKYIHSEYYSKLYTDLSGKEENKSTTVKNGYDFGLYFNSYMTSAKIDGDYVTPYDAFGKAGFVDEDTFFGVGDNSSDFGYTIDEATNSVVLTKYTGENTNVVIAPTYKIDGTIYNTSIDTTTIFRENKTITSVIIKDGVKVASNSMAEMFLNCAKLEAVDLSGLDTSGVTSFYKLFMGCGLLKTLDVTGLDTSSVENMGYMFDSCGHLINFIGYEDWDTSSVWNIYKLFNRTYSIQEVDLSKWDLSNVENSGWFFQYSWINNIILPDSLSLISAGFLNHATEYQGSTFTIPAGVKKIGYGHTFYDFGTDNFNEFIVDERNTNYKAIDGILYSADGSELLGVPRGKTFENNTFVIPQTVTFMGELCFSRNYNVETIVLPDNFIIKDVPKNSPEYVIQDNHGGNDSGNLNGGKNLTIAIYLYTGITKYDVRDTNTNYEAIDGVIYSEDMSTLIVIPTRYSQKLSIPEGVTTWANGASWSDKSIDELMIDCTGVSIPASMTDIPTDQLNKLNRLAKRTSKPFTIEVAEGNTTYYTDANGLLKKY